MDGKTKGEKIISVRMPTNLYDMLMKDGEDKISTKINKIVAKNLETKYAQDHKWMVIPRSLGIYLFDALTEAQIEKYCDILVDEIKQTGLTHFHGMNLWEIWLLMDRKFNENIGSYLTYDKSGDTNYYYLEHSTGRAVSEIIYRMFLHTAQNKVEIKKVKLDDKKLILEIKEKKSTK